MSKLKGNNFFKTIFSLFKSNEQKMENSRSNVNQNIKDSFVEIDKAKKRVWKKEYNPLRSTILWGYDNSNNPSFLILYGEHKFKDTENKGVSINNILEDYVKYTSYAVFKGKEGHLPSFQSIKIIEENGYYNKKKDDNSPKMYYKTGLKNYWSRDENYRFKGFVNLKLDDQIILPYFTSNSYEEYVKIIEKQHIKFSDFKLTQNPSEILKLYKESEEYEIIYDMLSNQNIYMRKKALNGLLETNPPKDIYKLLVNIGSTELISGLFLELAKRNNPVLIEEAKTIFEAEINWAEESYIKGVKRCANIYMAALNDELKAERIKFIYESLPEIDLHLTNINGNDIPKDKIIEGYTYRKYAMQGLLKENYGRYDNNQRKWVEYRCPERYKISQYTDGVILKTLELKNTIQEAEAYGLADVIGKIAYYLDAPRLTYYFKGSEKSEELKYYKRYIRRIIDSYGKNNSDKFMEVMKALLTSYTQYDYVCKFKGNFQFNEYIKNYLYYDFKEKPPIGWENWQARSEWMENDQLMKLQGRYEFMKEIWDNHLADVLEISIKAKINPILKACYYILKDSERTNDLIENMSYEELIDLTQGSYEPLANMFMDIVSNKLNSFNTFESKFMIALMNSSSEDIHDLAKEFLRRTKGSFSANDIVDLMLLDNLDIWIDLFKESILSLNENEYLKFMKIIIESSDKFRKYNINFSKDIKDILSFTTSKIQDISEYEKSNFIVNMISEATNITKMPEWLKVFIEELIFSVSYEELDKLLMNITIEPINKTISQSCRQVISLLESIQNTKLPLDSQIVGILETGTAQMINILFEIIMKNSEELRTRFSTLLIMFESDITILNQKAEEIFDNMSGEKRKKLHGIIIDSPVNKVYSFGLRKLDEIYNDLIPIEFIIQMLEHNSIDVKAYISNKTDKILDNLGNGDEELFIYYTRTLLFLPNKVSKSKDNIYRVIPKFVLKYKDKLDEFEDILLDIGGSNIITDSERALITLAKIRKEVVLVES